MSIFLWILQALLALHTIVGAIWKFSNSEQTVEALKAIPHSIWIGISLVELLLALGLLLPVLNKSWGWIVPIAAAGIALEMLVFCGLQIASGDKAYGQIVYWLLVAGICGFIAYDRQVLNPH